MRKNMYGWYVVFINAFIGCVLSAGFPQSSMTIAYLAERMGASQEALLVGDTIKTIGIIVAMLVSGVVYKKIGAKKTFLLGMVVLIPPLIMTPYVNSVILFYVLKFLQGFASIIFPMFLVIIMGWIDERNRGLSTAIFNGIFYGGAGIGGTFSGYVISQFGWVESYWALAILQLITAIIWLLTVRENSVGSEVAEEKSNVPFRRMLAMPMVWLLVFAFLSTTWSVQAISVDMSLFSGFLGYSEMETGKVMSAITIGIISACVISGKASDFLAGRMAHKGKARLITYAVGCVITILAVVMLILFDMKTFMTFYITVLLFSFGASWGLGVFYSILPEFFDGDSLPVATGFIGGVGDAGMTIAPVLVGIIFGVKGLWNIGWGTCAVIAAVSLVSSLLLIGMINKQRKVG